MPTLWDTFPLWQQLLLYAVGAVCIAVVGDWFITLLIDPFDEEE